MLNYSMETNDGSKQEKPIVKISYRIISAKRFREMTEKQKETVVNMIERFEKCLSASKHEIKKKMG